MLQFNKIFSQDNFDILDFDLWEHEITMGGGGNWEFQVSCKKKPGTWFLKCQISDVAMKTLIDLKNGQLHNKFSKVSTPTTLYLFNARCFNERIIKFFYREIYFAKVCRDFFDLFHPTGNEK